MRKFIASLVVVLSLMLASSPALAVDYYSVPQITLKAVSVHCEQVIASASGYGLAYDNVFQFSFRGNGKDNIVTTTKSYYDLVVAGATLADGWYEVQIRTRYGGYLRYKPFYVWVYVEEC